MARLRGRAVSAATVDELLDGLEDHVAPVMTDLNLLELYLRREGLLTTDQYGRLHAILEPVGRAGLRILERDLRRTSAAEARR